MSNRQIKKILNKLSDHEKRICTLEGSSNTQVVGAKSASGKQKTLREIVKGRKFKNGQQQVAIIVGYNENILGTLIICEDNIKTEWINTKMTNKYSKNFLDRAKTNLYEFTPMEPVI